MGVFFLASKPPCILEIEDFVNTAELVQEWSEKNEIKPTEVSIGSHKKVIWKCRYGHEWEASVKSRTINGTGCPYCSHNPAASGVHGGVGQVDAVAGVGKRDQERLQAAFGKGYIQSDYVCTWADGNVISPNYLSRTFHNVISKSSLPNVRLHDLRHSAVSNLLNMGFSIVQVQQWLGHGSASTTLNFYAHVDKNSKLDMAAAMEKAIYQPT